MKLSWNVYACCCSRYGLRVNLSNIFHGCYCCNRHGLRVETPPSETNCWNSWAYVSVGMHNIGLVHCEVVHSAYLCICIPLQFVTTVAKHKSISITKPLKPTDMVMLKLHNLTPTCPFLLKLWPMCSPYWQFSISMNFAPFDCIHVTWYQFRNCNGLYMSMYELKQYVIVCSDDVTSTHPFLVTHG